MTFTETMTVLYCGKCRCTFAVPAVVAHRAFKYGGTLRCFNGHRNLWLGEPAKPEKPTKRERGEIVKALHRAEQAEAKVEELRGEHA